MLRYLQGAKIGRMGEVSTQSSHFCDFMLYCNDKQCWSVCIANLAHLIDNCGFNYKTYYQMVSALSTFDEWIGTEKCTFQERVPSIDKKHLPYLFLLPTAHQQLRLLPLHLQARRLHVHEERRHHGRKQHQRLQARAHHRLCVTRTRLLHHLHQHLQTRRHEHALQVRVLA